jgi:hypothetical protein
MVFHRNKEGLLSAASIGVFLVLIGTLFMINSVQKTTLSDNIMTFFNNFNVTQVNNSTIYLPSPIASTNTTVLEANQAVYAAVEQFSLAWGIFLIILLAVRFVTYSPTRKKADNFGNIVFWLGAAYLTRAYLIDTSKWFVYWSLIIVLIGISLIVRAVYLAAAWKGHK